MSVSRWAWRTCSRHKGRSRSQKHAGHARMPRRFEATCAATSARPPARIRDPFARPRAARRRGRDGRPRVPAGGASRSSCALVRDRRARADGAARPAGVVRGVVGRRGRATVRRTTGCASPIPAITSSRSTIRTATAACSPTSICTCSAKARTTARSRSSARTASRSASTTGVHFAVWAPNADRVSVIGDFNGWDGRVHADAAARADRRLGDLHSRSAGRREVQVRDPHARPARC